MSYFLVFFLANILDLCILDG